MPPTFKKRWRIFIVTMAELAVRLPHDQKVVGSNLAGSKSDLTKLKPYCLLQHVSNE